MIGASIPDTASGPWPAPAKLNLLLHVTGRRADGYHELQTLFQFLTYGDWLYFDLNDTGCVTRVGGPSLVAEADDLTVRAALSLQRLVGCPGGVTIYNDKRLPCGGGLGGGSSDAATVLLVLNRLWDLGLEINVLADLGLSLGADLPVFVHGTAALAEGVGERLTPVTPVETWFLVIDPAVSISTATVFSAPELTRDTQRQTIADLLSGPRHNDCEPVVRSRYPEVAAAIDWLSKFSPAQMTGTGGCVFAAFEYRAQAEAVAARIPAPWEGFVARGVNRSPLLSALE